MTYRTEFPDFDPATMPADIPAGFVDISWRLNECGRGHAEHVRGHVIAATLRGETPQ